MLDDRITLRIAKKDKALLDEFADIHSKALELMREVQKTLDESKLDFFWKQLSEKAKIAEMYPIYARSINYQAWEPELSSLVF